MIVCGVSAWLDARRERKRREREYRVRELLVMLIGLHKPDLLDEITAEMTSRDIAKIMKGHGFHSSMF